jgi:hypothetical protein
VGLTSKLWTESELEEISQRKIKEAALRLVHDRVGNQVSTECYPVLYRQFLRESGETVGFFQGWGFHSLLGAMYLQMMWLMTEGSNARRCKGPRCFRVISPSSRPGSRLQILG